ncbi:hypothetical protein QZH41_013024 [Actinostola sp. cb2023]|nr:hypothetical protein QZH41_013024 [Actinostola sp. cb2023]
MIGKARKKAYLPMGSKGAPERCYTHQSESLNNMLTRRKEAFIKNHKGALYGGSNEYELADITKYLLVPPDTWFVEWTHKQREEYIRKFNQLSVQDAMAEKQITVSPPTDTQKDDDNDVDTISEFITVPQIVGEQVKAKRGYSDELIKSLTEAILVLLNSTGAIQREPTLAATAKVKYFVASKSAKNGYYVCTTHAHHVSCVCPAYKHDSVCKHSLSVAIKIGLVESHMKQMQKNINPSRAGLLLPTGNTTAGKKGGRNKTSWRPPCSGAGIQQKTTTETGTDLKGFTPAVHHNDEPFIVILLEDEPKAKECRACKTGFIRRNKNYPL